MGSLLHMQAMMHLSCQGEKGASRLPAFAAAAAAAAAARW